MILTALLKGEMQSYLRNLDWFLGSGSRFRFLRGGIFFENDS